MTVTVGSARVRTDINMTILAVGAQDATTRYSLRIASDGAEVRAAQRLRHLVFAEELGATLRTTRVGFDVDDFDAFCDHLVIVEESTREVVGTYRLLPPDRAVAAGRSYSETEFDLSRLAPLRADLVDAGRTCVHPAHRTDAVTGVMWAGIAQYLRMHGFTWIGGCVPVPLGDRGMTAASVWRRVSARHLSPLSLRVVPYWPWPAEDAPVADGLVSLPPLLRGYLRLGAWVCGPPAYDPDFAVADLYMLLPLDRVDPRYLTGGAVSRRSDDILAGGDAGAGAGRHRGAQ